MKRLFVVLFSISVFCNLFAQNDTISISETISELYKTQDYQLVVDLCEQTVANGQESAELYYNLGNAYFKMNELPKAILNYEKALLLSPNDKDIQYNLAFAYSHQPDNIEHLSLGFLPRMYQKFYRLFPVDAWAIIGIIFGLMFCVSVCVFLFSQDLHRKKFSLVSLLCGLVFSILSICCANSRYKELNNHEYAIVIEPTTSIKTEPTMTSMDLAIIHGGIKVKIIEEAFGWLKVELGNGKEGWIVASNVEKI